MVSNGVAGRLIGVSRVQLRHALRGIACILSVAHHPDRIGRVLAHGKVAAHGIRVPLVQLRRLRRIGVVLERAGRPGLALPDPVALFVQRLHQDGVVAAVLRRGQVVHADGAPVKLAVRDLGLDDLRTVFVFRIVDDLAGLHRRQEILHEFPAVHVHRIVLLSRLMLTSHLERGRQLALTPTPED
jgi:hypothetical protein